MIEVAECSERTIDCFAKQTYEVPDALRVWKANAPNAGPPEENFVEIAAIAAQLEVEASDFGCFRILSQTDGDKRVVWCRRVLAEIGAAKKMFMDLLSKGMVPYKVGIDGVATADVMTEFDPTAEEVIFMPVQAIGGG